MSLIIMCCYDTEENGRSEYTKQALKSLSETVNWNKHRLVVVDNNSCDETKNYLSFIKDMPPTGNFGYRIPGITIITLSENVGTARALNMGIKMRHPDEACIKYDNDVVVNQSGWADEMEEAVARDPKIGIVGLKRKDINFDPNNENEAYRSTLVGLPHEPGQSWINVEKGPQIMGTCTLFNPALIDAIGYSWQPGLYGLEDTLYSLRSELAGFWNCYLPHIKIDHIDRGDNPYTYVKHKQAGEAWPEYVKYHQGYIDGTIPLYYDGGFSE